MSKRLLYTIISPTIHYELTNHLGNVMAVITDEPTDAETPAVESLADYYPFGMTMPGRSYNAHTYRHGFTGHEKESDLAEGIYTTEYRLYDARVGRWLSVDPLSMDNAGESPYLYCSGMPMTYFDPDGREKIDCFNKNYPTREELNGRPFEWQTNLINHRTTNAKFFDGHVYSYTRNIGVIHLWGHGSPHSIQLYDPIAKKDIICGRGGDLGIEYIHYLLLERSEIYHRNNPTDENDIVDQSESKCSILVLHSCETGKETGIGQEISKHLNLLVVAPSDIVSCSKKGEEKVKNNGVWNIYYKGELMASFDGKQEPLFDNPEKTIEKYEKMYQKKHNDFNKESYEE